MAGWHPVSRYRKLYRMLLRLYPRPHRQRFAESMEQTFNDLCHERAESGEGLAGLVLWLFAETTLGIIREQARWVMLQETGRRLIAWAIVVACILLIPLAGNLFVEGWNWGPRSFVVAGAVLFSAGAGFILVTRNGSKRFRLATAIATIAAVFLFWVNAAVGFIGDNNPANLLYLGVIALGMAGAMVARLRPRGMSLVLLGMAVAQATVPVVALLAWRHDFSPGVAPVFVLNSLFVAVWLISALLYWQAGAHRVQNAQ